MEIIGIIEANNSLGEGPVWSVEEQALYWVDIDNDLFQRWDLNTKEITNWKLPATIGSFAFRKSGGFVLALRSGLAFFSPETGYTQLISNPISNPSRIRFNDGKCDRYGRFWVGTMDEEFNDPLGSLYCLDINSECRIMKEGIGISNGLGWSPDNSQFYYTDSSRRSIWAYDYNINTGGITNERIFVETANNDIPDGLTIDSDGYVWSAKWDGWKIVRYSPQGNIDKRFSLPVQRPTSCTFGGSKLELLFVTTAKIDLSVSSLEEQPNAGNIFIIKTDCKGLPEPKFAG